MEAGEALGNRQIAADDGNVKRLGQPSFLLTPLPAAFDLERRSAKPCWAPAFAGMTGDGVG
jgi:hypothetical protein